MVKSVLISLFAVAAASAQSLSVGVIGGAPFTDVVNKTNANNFSTISKSTNFTIGGSLQVNLPLSFRIEADALYRPYSFELDGVKSGTDISSKQLRFPVLLQYRFGAPVLKPFVEGGFVYDHLADISAAAKNIASGPGQLLHQNDAGAVLGVGADLKVPFARISAEVRYTRETVSNFANFSNLNQAEVLVGVHF